MIKKGFTNADSGEISTGNFSLIQENSGYIPQDILNNPWFKFIMNGIWNRKIVLKTIKDESQKLGIDYKIVLSSLLWEQIRIANRGLRGELKNIILHSTPKLFRSYDTSLGIGGIKITTAKRIEKDAITYGYGEIFKTNPTDNAGRYLRLTENDYWQGIYPTYLIKNILTRWTLSGYNITNNPWIIGTLYNMWNIETKQPNANPQIGGSIIIIGEKQYTYGEISLYAYRYLLQKGI